MNARYIPFEKRTKKEQRQLTANRLVVWTRIAAQDSARVTLEETLAHTGIHNAHVVEFMMEQAGSSSRFRREAFIQAEEIELLKKFD